MGPSVRRMLGYGRSGLQVWRHSGFHPALTPLAIVIDVGQHFSIGSLHVISHENVARS